MSPVIRELAPSSELLALLENLTSIARAARYTDRQTVLMGGSFQVNGQTAELEQLATPQRGRILENVCEIGFNAGHGTASLMLRNNATMQSFDTMGLPWSPCCLQALQDRFPGRVTLHRGDSLLTLPRYAHEVRQGTKPPCDVTFIDGEHWGRRVVSDFHYALLSLREGGVIVADDTTPHWPDVQREWQTRVRLGHIVSEYCYQAELPSLGWRGYCHGISSGANIVNSTRRSANYTRRSHTAGSNPPRCSAMTNPNKTGGGDGGAHGLTQMRPAFPNRSGRHSQMGGTRLEHTSSVLLASRFTVRHGVLGLEHAFAAGAATLAALTLFWTVRLLMASCMRQRARSSRLRLWRGKKRLSSEV